MITLTATLTINNEGSNLVLEGKGEGTPKQQDLAESFMSQCQAWSDTVAAMGNGKSVNLTGEAARKAVAALAALPEPVPIKEDKSW